MCGIIVEAHCACGFERSFRLGDGFDGSSYVMAYTEDGEDLVEMKITPAEKRNRKILNFPRDDGRSSWEDKGPYGCPYCKKQSLMLRLVAFWD